MAINALTAIQNVSKQINEIVVGKEIQIKQSIACILAGGHLLLEDVPGVGKTTFSHAMAISFGLDYSRVQFTSDMLPADIIGVSVFDRESSSFQFHKGPVFSQVLLADEINRATPKTQSAMLEAMEEMQVTSDGVTRSLPDPFFVIATQNPQSQIGTFPLPESQMDRFLMCISLGYPTKEAELSLLMGEDRRKMMKKMLPAITLELFLEAKKSVELIHVSRPLALYVQALAENSRTSGYFIDGMSPRASLSLLRAGRAWAALEGRDNVIPEDIKACLIPVVAHRLRVSNANIKGATNARSLLLDMLKNVPI
jgi:MoxR-like ATPase